MRTLTLTAPTAIPNGSRPRSVIARILGATIQRGTPDTPGCMGCGRDRVRYITRGNERYDGTHGPGWIATETYCSDCIWPDAEILLECHPEVVPGMTDEEHDRQVQAALQTA